MMPSKKILRIIFSTLLFLMCVSTSKWLTTFYENAEDKTANLEINSSDNPSILWNEIKKSKTLWKLCSKHQLRNNSFSRFADKHWVKSFISNSIPDIKLAKEFKYVNTSIDITASFLKSLPQIYVMKPNHMCGETIIVSNGTAKCYTNVVNCLSCNKNLFACLKKSCGIWLNTIYSKGYETYYEPIERKCIFEELLSADDSRPMDYKIHTYNGKAYVVQVVEMLKQGRLVDYFTPKWKRIQMGRTPDNWPISRNRSKPDFLSKMINFTNVLARSFRMMRIDFFGFGNYFSFAELSPSPNGCTTRYVPSIYDMFYGYIFSNPDQNIDPESVLSIKYLPKM